MNVFKNGNNQQKQPFERLFFQPYSDYQFCSHIAIIIDTLEHSLRGLRNGEQNIYARDEHYLDQHPVTNLHGYIF